MNIEEYNLGFYSIFIGIAASTIIINWARILKNFPNEKITWDQYVWSLLFFLIIVWEWFLKKDFNEINSPILLLFSLVNPILIYFICYLTLPQTENDYSFESQKVKFALLTIIWVINKFVMSENNLHFFSYSRIEYVLIIFIYLIMLLDRRTIIWKASSIINILFFISLFLGFFGHIKLIAFLLISIVSYLIFVFLERIKVIHRNRL